MAIIIDAQNPFQPYDQNKPADAQPLTEDVVTQIKQDFEYWAGKRTYVREAPDEAMLYVEWMVERAIADGANREEAEAAYDSKFSDLGDLIARYGYEPSKDE